MVSKSKLESHPLGDDLEVVVRHVKKQPSVCIQRVNNNNKKRKACVCLSENQYKNLVKVKAKLLQELTDIVSIANKNNKTKKTTQNSSTQTENPQTFYQENSVLGEEESCVEQTPQFQIDDSTKMFAQITSIDDLLQVFEGGCGQYLN